MKKFLFVLTLALLAWGSVQGWAPPAQALAVDEPGLDSQNQASAADEPFVAPKGPVPLMAEWPGFKGLAGAGAALIVVLAALLLFLKALQRVGRFKAGRGAMFEVRGYQPLDNRKYLAAVAVDGRLLIIGVTPDRLIPLGQWLLEDQGLFPPDGPDFGLRPAAACDAPPDISVADPQVFRP